MSFLYQYVKMNIFHILYVKTFITSYCSKHYFNKAQKYKEDFNGQR